ncbi:MAG: monovalent cation/H+ antiporter complex subunit F [Azospirillaceae bacterium]
MIATDLDGFLHWAASAAAGMILVALVCAAIRLLRGPTLPDRVIALDLVTMLLVAFLALFALAEGRPAYLDVALALALVAFLGTVAFARFIDRSPQARADKRATAVEAGQPGTDAGSEDGR